MKKPRSGSSKFLVKCSSWKFSGPEELAWNSNRKSSNKIYKYIKIPSCNYMRRQVPKEQV
ncbi:hypothetical protein HMPREF1548_04803 [Clostridium sp. KLE 1755]|nr:hypothetical protein HMPREF1548_04803 [Clostridium sp. KLE 1755]